MVWSFSQRPSSRWVAQYGGMKANERSAVTVLCERFGISERRACAVVGLHRSTMRLAPPPTTDEEARLWAWLRKSSTDRPRWGYGDEQRLQRASASCGATRACGSRSAARRNA